MHAYSQAAQPNWPVYCSGGSGLGIDGFRLGRPAVNELDLPAIVDELVPHLQRAGEFRTEYRVGETLRERLGLARALNRVPAGRP